MQHASDALDKRRTTTLVETDKPEPVMGLMRLTGDEAGRFWNLAETANPPLLTWLAVGANEGFHIRIEDDEYVSGNHCAFIYDPTARTLAVRDCNSKNRVVVDFLPVSGEMPATPGSLILLGTTQFLVCGPAMEKQRARIAAHNIDEFIRRAFHAYPRKNWAADAIGMARSTFRDWLAKLGLM